MPKKVVAQRQNTGTPPQQVITERQYRQYECIAYHGKLIRPNDKGRIAPATTIAKPVITGDTSLRFKAGCDNRSAHEKNNGRTLPYPFPRS